MTDTCAAGPPFVTRVRVRYADTDAEGVVYYGSYLVYFEVARVELLRELGCPVSEVRARGIVLPAVQATCRYHRPGRVDDLLDVCLWLMPRRRASLGFVYEVRRDGDVLASGSTRHAAVDVASGRAVPLPEWLNKLYDSAAEVVGTVR
jgi:acyl-CoA thioester hydrolase